MPRFWPAILLLIGFATTSSAHYNMLFPDKPWTEKGEKVTFTYQFGHPFEHELFDAPEPHMAVVILPDGKTQKIEKFTKILLPGADGKKVTAFTFPYEPALRGDHTVVLQTPPIWMEESKDFIQDSVKVVLHVQTQKNWDARLPASFENKWTMVPLTRPYGLLPGMVFQAQVGWRPPSSGFLGGTQVEIERYHPLPPKKLPPDELITFKAKCDPNGVVTFAFPDPAWWSMTAARPIPGPILKAGGNEGPVRIRTTFWLHVDEKK